MECDFTGKAVLVTGSSRGIGRGIAEAFHAAGAHVAFNGRNARAVDEAIKDRPRTLAASGDVTVPEFARQVVEQTVDGFGKLDVLVCSVGGGRSVPPGEETHEEWQRVFALNLWSAINTIEAARVALAETGGSIVCVSSICGLEVVPGAPVTYSAAKAALNAYVRGMARPLGRECVRVNAVAPGNVLFDGSAWARRLVDDPYAVETMLRDETALGRFGTPDEVAEVTLFLASEHAGFTTGSVWTLDGGQSRTN